MLVAKTETKERMQDGTSRVVPAGSPFLNPATAELPMINYWSDNVPEGTKSYDIALDKIPEKDLKYLVEDEKVDVVEEEIKDDSTNGNTESEADTDTDKPEQATNSDDANESEYTKEELDEMSIEVLKEILKDNKISFSHNSLKETLVNKILTNL